MTSKNRDSVVFGDYELDMDTRELRHLGKPVALQPRVLELLAFLIRERDRAVDKDAIQDAVWSGTIVSETALTRAIMKARRAVGDSAGQQVVIRTVHGHGYQFVANVETPPAETAEDPVSVKEASETDSLSDTKNDAHTNAGSTKSASVRWLLAAGVAIVAIAIAIIWREPAEPEGLRVAILPVHNATDSQELDWVKLGLLGFANDLMQNSTELQVVPASEMVRYAENSDWSPDAGIEHAPDHLATLRRAYGASHVVFSEIEETVGGLRLSYTLIGPDGKLNQSTMVGDQSTALIRGMVREVNSSLTRTNYLQSSENGIDNDPFISEAYARGISYSLAGQCNDALPLFQIVLDRSSNNYQARFEWANCARIAGKPDDAENALIPLVNELKNTEQTALRSRAIGLLGTVYHVTGRLDDAQTMLTSGLELAEKSGDKSAIGRLLNAQALLSKDRRDTEAAKQYLARAAVAYREAGREILPGQVYSALANLAMGEGAWSEAEEHLKNALSSFQALGDRRNEAMMLNNYGYLRRRQDRVEEAEPLHLESLKIRQEIGDRVGQGRILGMMSILYRGQHRFDEARDMAVQAIEIATEASDKLFIATGYAHLAAAEEGLAQPVQALVAYEQSLSLFKEIDDRLRMCQVELRIAQLEVDAEQLQAARSRLQRVLDLAASEELHEVAIEAQELEADLEIRLDNLPMAQQLYERTLELIEQHGFKDRRRAVRIKLGDAYLDDDQIELAEPLLGFILAEEISATGNKFHARYAFHQGEVERAVRLMEAAKELDESAWSDQDQEQIMRYRRLVEQK